MPSIQLHKHFSPFLKRTARPSHAARAATLLLASAMLAPATAHAGTSAGAMPVAATLLENCVVTATPLVFGDITLTDGAAVDSAATIALVCTPLASYEVALSDGANASGGTRRMKNALSADYIAYGIYSDAARTLPWGDSSGSDTVSGSVGLTGLATLTAYGRIAAETPVAAAGIYADVVTVTVTF
ncbi:MAG: spore coat U domain-containing protein [Blastomonas sp.]